MSNTISLDYLRGEIQPGVAFRIAVMISYDSYNTSGIFSPTSTDLELGDENWGILGVEEKYTNFEDIYHKPFYYKDSSLGLYYYPIYLDSSKGYSFIVDGYKFYYNPQDRYPNDSSIDKGTPESPSNDKNYRSYEIMTHIPFYVFGTEVGDTENGYFWPLFLEPIVDSNPYHQHTFVEYPDTTFYMKDSDSTNHHANHPPNEAQCVVYNNYDTLSDTLFKYNQVGNGTITFEVVTTGNYSHGAQRYKYIGVDKGSDVLTPYENNKRAEFSLAPYHNLSRSVIFSGTSYKLYHDNDSINLKFIDNIVKGDDTLVDNLSGKYVGTPSTHKFMGLADKPDHLDLFTLNSEYINFFFIPYRESTLSLTSHHNIIYDRFLATDYLLMFIHEVNPLIRDQIKKFKKDSGQVYSGEIAHTPNRSEAIQGYHSRYCLENENCGPCKGICAAGSTGKRCIADSVSKDKPLDEYFTCEPERFYESSNDIKKTQMETNSKTVIIIVVVIAVIILTGIILYEERKTILKEFYKLKNGL